MSGSAAGLRAKVVVPLTALAQSLGAAPGLMKRLDRAGLITPVGRERGGEVWVDSDARRQLERVVALIGAGYAERDIANVIGRIERTKRTPPAEVITLSALAAATGVSVETARAWVVDGTLHAWAQTEEGEPLFGADAPASARVLAALATLGLGELARAWLHGADDERAAALDVVRKHLSAIEGATRVLRKLAPAEPKRRRLLTRRRPK